MNKRKKVLKGALWFLGVLLAGLIGSIINSALAKVNLWESFKQIITSMVKLLLNVDVILSCSILVLFYLVYRLYKKFQSVSPDRIDEVIASNNSLKKYNEELRKSANNIIKRYEAVEEENSKLKAATKLEEELEPKEEVILILDVLANQPDRSWSFTSLHHLYNTKFGKQMSDFQIIINKLERKGLIQETSSGTYDELGYSIGSEGLSFLGILK